MTQTALFRDPSPPAGAIISPCGLYRYRLWRTIGPEPKRVLFTLLNPSRADALLTDPTLVKMMGFAKLWGCGRLDVCNMFGYRSTDPKILRSAHDPIGPDNDNHIAQATAEAELIVAAWGGSIPRAHAHRRGVMRRLFEGKTVWCLSKTAAGDPRHVLYLPYSVPLEVLWQP